MTVSFSKKGRLGQGYTEEKHMKIQAKEAICKPRRETSEKSTRDTWISD